ncbi:unnamed protein product [Brassica rapa]|uniref:NAC domain-containing protein n=1 Tax=Brassica campestris TaxID=3711 RepID=A0A8D9MGC3_BRACM|nr:unnamed protein product [Brassica rapa]
MSGEGKDHEEEDEAKLPGFRFHPTDEELLGYYLRRKVENKPIKLELIKQIDIYKFDPWDLPRVSSVGENEWYFFCMRGRKYKNSVRPNRVTGSGFWKATGIDKPVYSNLDCIGLKKSLVYYLGSAGKGSKTNWMMHEFRLPSTAKSESPTQQATSSLDSDHTSHHVVESLSHKLHEPQRQPQTHNPYWNQLTTVGFNQPTYTCHDNNLVNLWNINGEDFIGNAASWDELRSVIDGNTNHL